MNMLAHDSDGFQTPHWMCLPRAFLFFFFNSRLRTCRHKSWGPRSCRGRRSSSSSDLSAPVITPYTPQSGPPAHLSVTARSPTSPAKQFISGLVQVLASIWHNAHAGKRVKKKKKKTVALCACVNVCSQAIEHCIFYAGWWQRKSHLHCLCSCVAFSQLHLFYYE